MRERESERVTIQNPRKDPIFESPNFAHAHFMTEFKAHLHM